MSLKHNGWARTTFRNIFPPVFPPLGADPHPQYSTRRKAGRNLLNEEITLLLPIAIGERLSQTISNSDKQRSCADVHSPYKR
jgi:hypothetical protein